MFHPFMYPFWTKLSQCSSCCCSWFSSWLRMAMAQWPSSLIEQLQTYYFPRDDPFKMTCVRKCLQWKFNKSRIAHKMVANMCFWLKDKEKENIENGQLDGGTVPVRAVFHSLVDIRDGM